MNINQEVQDFISRKESNGALLITGQWGCGKTYMVRQVAEKLNSGNQYAIAFVSLFGVDSTDTLNRKVKEAVAYAKTFNKVSDNQKNSATALLGVVKSITSALSDSSGVVKSIDTALSINWYDFIDVENEVECYGQGNTIKSKKKLVIVFDDLERCSLNTVEMLGSINDYSENRKIKTIVIADENHIKEENLERYNEFKEKLISRTIRLTSDYPSIIHTIIQSYIETVPGYGKILQENYSLLTQVFLESKSENIRTFKSFIIDFERVFDLWESASAPHNRLNGVLYTFGAILFEFKGNRYNKNDEYGYIFDRTKLKEKYVDIGDYMSFLASLEKWITSGEWIEDEVLSEIKRKYLPNNPALSEDQKFLCGNFWDLDQKCIDDGVPISLERAYKSDLSCDELITFLQKVHSLRENDICIPVEIDYLQIQRGFKNRKEKIKSGDITEPQRQTFSRLDQIDEEANELYKEIENLDSLINVWKNRSNFISFLKKDTGISRYDLKRQCIEVFDDSLLELFVEQYKTSDNFTKRELASSLFDLCLNDPQCSSSDCVKESVANLRELNKLLEGSLYSETDQISKAIARSFIRNLDNYIEKLVMKVVEQ